MLDAPHTELSPHTQIFAYHPITGGVISVQRGRRGYSSISTRLSAEQLNALLCYPPPHNSEIAEMIAFALGGDDKPKLTDIDVSAGWPK